MLEQDILRVPPKVLDEGQRRQFFDRGFLVLSEHVPAPWLARLQDGYREILDSSRTLLEDNKDFKLADGHGPDSPRLERVERPQDLQRDYWEFLSDPVMTDLAADLVGPDVKFSHCGINVKPGHQASKPFFWHQDILAWPHTDFSPLTIAVYLEDCEMEQGPLAFVAGSHRGQFYPTYDKDNSLKGVPNEVIESNAEHIEYAVGKAGTIVAIHCCVIHGSNRNATSRSRITLLPVYSSADSFPYVRRYGSGIHSGEVVRGEWPEYACFDARRVPVPPRRSHYLGLSPWKGEGKSHWQKDRQEMPTM